MPLSPEEPQIHESAQGPRVASATGRPAPPPRPVPGPRSAAMPRPGRPVPGPVRPAPPAQRSHAAGGRSSSPAPAPPHETRPTPQIQLIAAPAAGALDAADEAVDVLLDSGRAPADILVLTTGEQHPWAAHELSFGEAGYWAQHDARDDVFCADAAVAERAAARPVVVVAVNTDDGTAADDLLSRVLPLARARASALLIMCGDPQRINAVLGAGV